MAKTPDAAIKLLSDLGPAATAQARREAEKLQAMINKQRGGFKLAPWDWQYYAEQVRKAEYALDETQDRKSTRLNSSHGYISYAVFCLKKKKKKKKSYTSTNSTPQRSMY